jgi:ribosomal protein L40E
MVLFTGGFPLFLFVVAAMLLVMLIWTASMHRQHSQDTDQRLCRGCGSSHPTYAQFCRRCGRRL